MPDQYSLLAVLTALWRESLLRAARKRGLVGGKDYVRKDLLVDLLLRAPGLTLSRSFLGEFKPVELDAACRKLKIEPDGDGEEALILALLSADHGESRGHTRRWRPFPEARAFVRELGLLDLADWMAYTRGQLKEHKGELPDDIPKSPGKVYRGEGWRGIRDFIGEDAGRPAEEKYLEFRAARRLARRFGLRSRSEWDAWCAGDLHGRAPCPTNLPTDPERVYAKAWRGWKDWLGNLRRTAPGRLPFVEARAFARTLGLKSAAEWRSWCRGDLPELGSRPADVPACPNVIYNALGWKGFGDWLGTGNKAKRGRPRMPFDAARSLARSLQLANVHEWLTWWRGNRRGETRERLDIPSRPYNAYRNEGWVDWADFLGTTHRKGQFRAFPAARAWARTLAFRNTREWSAFCRGEFGGPGRPIDIPANPAVTYRGKGWIGWRDWLGTAWEKRGDTQPPRQAGAGGRTVPRSLFSS